LKADRKAVLKATATPPKEGDFVWDGKDEDDRPLSKQEMRQGIRNRGGRPRKENPKIQISIRYSPEVVAYFKSIGKGWQTRMDEALKEWMREHGA